jgi:hypothetical protein
MQDMIRHGRTTRGQRNRANKLTPSEVEAIRLEYVPRKVSMRKLAEKYGVKTITIFDIIHGRNWAWL